MIKCKNDGCPKGYDICCEVCEEKDICEARCDLNVSTCGFSVINEETALESFKDTNLGIFKDLAEIIQQKKKLEAEEKELKVDLMEAMKKFNIKKFENDDLSVVYKAPTTRTSVDSKKLKTELPEIHAKYTKTSNVSESITVKIKE